MNDVQTGIVFNVGSLEDLFSPEYSLFKNMPMSTFQFSSSKLLPNTIIVDTGYYGNPILTMELRFIKEGGSHLGGQPASFSI